MFVNTYLFVNKGGKACNVQSKKQPSGKMDEQSDFRSRTSGKCLKEIRASFCENANNFCGLYLNFLCFPQICEHLNFFIVSLLNQAKSLQFYWIVLKLFWPTMRRCWGFYPTKNHKAPVSCWYFIRSTLTQPIKNPKVGIPCGAQTNKFLLSSHKRLI